MGEHGPPIICAWEKVDISSPVIRILNPIKPFPKQVFKSSENTVGKGEIACNKQFLLFPQCFQPF